VTIKPAAPNIRRVPARAYFEHLMCRTPGCDGELLNKGGGYVHATDPPSYSIPHGCVKCVMSSIEGESYPRLVHVEEP
jgi:hypothetical protein